VAELSDIRRHGAPFDLAQLRVPLVLGRGSASIPHHRRAIDALVELVPDAEVVEIPGSAHGAPLSHPDAFAAFVRRVVERAMGAPRPG
jgi:pimeloyl-ACP methyl ester carboxylesterase